MLHKGEGFPDPTTAHYTAQTTMVLSQTSSTSSSDSPAGTGAIQEVLLARLSLSGHCGNK